MDVTLAIITATNGRDTLTRTLASLAPQLGDGDELLVLRRDGVPWGNATRDEAMARATASHLWWMDDDDIATEGALEAIRQGVAEDPETVHIFKMQGRLYHGDQEFVLWEEPKVEFCRVGGTMCVVPNIPEKLGTWVHTERDPPGRCGDWHFLTQTLERLGREPCFHEDIIARIRP